MTTRNSWMMAALVGWLVAAIAVPAQAGLVSWQYFSTTDGVAYLFNSPGTITTVATGQFRAGGTTSPEIRVQNGDMNLGQPYDQGNLTWDITGGNNSLSAGYGGPLAGDFQLEATGSGGTTDSAISLPTDWFNQVLIDLSSDAIIGSIFGNLNGQNFNLGVDWSTGNTDDNYDAILFTFDNAPGTTPVWEMTADMSMTTLLPGLNENDFMSEVTLFQNIAVVPEPATFGLFGIGLLVLGARKIRRRFVIG